MTLPLLFPAASSEVEWQALLRRLGEAGWESWQGVTVVQRFDRSWYVEWPVLLDGMPAGAVLSHTDASLSLVFGEFFRTTPIRVVNQETLAALLAYFHGIRPRVLDIASVAQRDLGLRVDLGDLSETTFYTRLREAVAQARLQGTYAEEVQLTALLTASSTSGYTVDCARVHETVAALMWQQATANQMMKGSAVGPWLEAQGYQSPLVTPTGKPSWSVDALELLPSTPEIQAALTMKKTTAALTATQLFASNLPPKGLLTVHPTWRTTSKTHAPFCWASQQALHTLPAIFRNAFPAPRTGWWVSVEWPLAEHLQVAVLAHDEDLFQIAGQGQEEAPGVSNRVLDLVLSGEPPRSDQDPLAPLVRRFVELFPMTAAWADRVRFQARKAGYVVVDGQRRIVVDPAHAGRTLVTYALRQRLRRTLGAMDGEAYLESAHWRRFGSLVPYAAKVFYTVDLGEAITPVEHLTRVMYHWTKSSRDDGAAFPARCALGTTWGTMTPVPDVAHANTVADLMESHRGDPARGF